jgi:hypothetical protein
MFLDLVAARVADWLLVKLRRTAVAATHNDGHDLPLSSKRLTWLTPGATMLPFFDRPER